MNNIPPLIFLIIIGSGALAERIARQRTATFRRKSNREWTVYLIAVPLCLMIVTAVIEYRELHTQPSSTMIILGSLIALMGTMVRVWCHFELDGAFSPYIEKSENQRIIRSGLYAKIRHPMYIGSILHFIGYPLMLAAEWAWCFSILAIFGIFIRIYKEEKFLAKEFPGYLKYMSETWRLIPYIY